MSQPSMEQLAKELGVSKSLVSLALSGKYGVSEEMGKAAVRLLLHRIDHPDEVIREETLEVRLEERNSVRDLTSEK